MNHLLIRLQDEQKILLLKQFLESIDYVESVEILEAKDSPSEVPTPPYYEPKSTYSAQEIQAIANKFPADKLWTYADLWEIFPHDLTVKVEILNNRLLIRASPSFIHQKISSELSFEMTSFVKKNKLGQVLYAPMDTKFDENNVVQPDILFIAVTRYHIIEKNAIHGAPDLLVEILSPSNDKKEQIEKRDLYEKGGVREYWTIFPKNREVKVEVLKEGKFALFSEGKKEGIIKSSVLEGFEIKIEELMPETLFQE